MQSVRFSCRGLTI